MKQESNLEVVILASNGSTGILQDLGIRQEVMNYFELFRASAGKEIKGDGDFFTNLEFFIENMGRPDLKNKAFQAKKNYDFKFLNGIILKSFLDRKGFRVKLINNLEFEKESLSACLKEEPLAVLISTTFLPTRLSVERVVSQVRSIYPETIIIAGGPHIYYSYKIFKEYKRKEHEDILGQTFFFQSRDFMSRPPMSPDIFIIDKQGLKTLEVVLGALKANSSIQTIPNLAFYDQTGRLNMTRRIPEDHTPFDHKPDWENLETEYIGPRMSVQGSVGCPWNCKFCNFHLFFDKFRAKSIEAVRQELKQLSRRSEVKHIRFTDDNLFFNPKSVEAFCSMMVEEDFPFTWSSMMRADSITPKTAELFRKAKATELLFGMESGDKAVLENMNKRIDPKQYLTAIKLLNENEISTESNLFFGFPGETVDSVKRTTEMLQNIGNSGSTVNWFSPFVFIIFPFTPIDFEREKYNLKGLFTEWEHQTMKSSEAFRIFADILFKIDNLTVSDRYISTDYQILPRSEVWKYSKHRAKLNNVIFRIKESGNNDVGLFRERDFEIKQLQEIYLQYLDHC